MHVDDMIVGNTEFCVISIRAINRDYQIVSEDANGIMCVGQRVRWMEDNGESLMQVTQERVVEELGEIEFDKQLKDADVCDAAMHAPF